MIYILTVCFNNIEGLKKTYKSVLAQTSTDYEWIVVDGNSSDGTVKWLESLDDEKTSFISEPDKGIYDAMNKAIRSLSGKSNGHFIFMNSGDEFYEATVLEQVNNNASNNVIIYGNYNDISLDGSSKIKKAKSPKHLTKGMLTSHQSIFFDIREYHNLFHDLSYKLSGDYDYIIRAFEIARLKKLSTKRLDVTICNFYLDGVSVTKRKQALKEDYLIRKNTLRLSAATSSFLYLAHLAHFFLKGWFPTVFVKRRLG